MKHADGSKVFSHNDHARGWHKGGRGTTVVVFNGLLEETDEKFFVFTNMVGLTSFLNDIPGGMIVSVTTVDDPFAYWRGKTKKAVNAALESMGIPAPNQGKNPQYRGAYAGFGLSGCQARGTCPEWAGSVYTGRFGWPATYSAKICTGSWRQGVVCRAGCMCVLLWRWCVCVCVCVCVAIWLTSCTPTGWRHAHHTDGVMHTIMYTIWMASCTHLDGIMSSIWMVSCT